MQWFYSKGGSQNGPISQEVLVSKISSGEIYQSDMVWREGMTDWLPVSKIPELAAALSPAQGAGPLTPLTGAAPNSPYAPPATTSPAPAPAGPIPNYLWQSIVVTILCCWPFGIPAIIFAAKVDGLVAKGDVNGALEASRKAKKWCIITVGAGLVVVSIWVLFTILGFAGAAIAPTAPTL